MLNDDTHDHHWSAADLSPDDLEEVQKIYQRLTTLLPDPTLLTTDDLDGDLTEDQAYMVMRAARRMLLFQLLMQEFHQHVMDDCGDYLAAATWGWKAVFEDAWENDFQDYPAHIKNYLTNLEDYPVGGCDGEVRHSVVPNFDPYEED